MESDIYSELMKSVSENYDAEADYADDARAEAEEADELEGEDRDAFYQM